MLVCFSQIPTMANGRPDEETPLLQGKFKTPVPWGQVNLIFVALIAEPISSLYIVPFINQVSQQLFPYLRYLTLARWIRFHIIKKSLSASSASREETIAGLVIMRVSS